MRRAQLTALAAFESLKIQSLKQSKSLLKQSKFYVNEDLKEVTMGLSSQPDFKSSLQFHKLGEYDKYTLPYISIDKLKALYFESTAPFQANNQYFTEYLHTGFFKFSEGIPAIEENDARSFWRQLVKDKPSLKNLIQFKEKDENTPYDKWLNSQIGQQKLIVIGGHSKWFQEFVKKYATDKSLKAIWGSKSKQLNPYTDKDGKIQNGNMVDVVIKKSAQGNSIEIVSINGVFKNENPTMHLLYIRHVESAWNEFKEKGKKLKDVSKLVHKDAKVSVDGKEQLSEIYKHFADAVMRHSSYKEIFEASEGKFHFEGTVHVYIIPSHCICSWHHNHYT